MRPWNIKRGIIHSHLVLYNTVFLLCIFQSILQEMILNSVNVLHRWGLNSVLWLNMMTLGFAKSRRKDLAGTERELFCCLALSAKQGDAREADVIYYYLFWVSQGKSIFLCLKCPAG